MKIAICQLNPRLGAMQSNAEKILAVCSQAHKDDAQLAITPELSLCGYPPQDMLFRPEFMTQVGQALSKIAQESALPVLVGAPALSNKKTGAPLYNAAYLCFAGQVSIVARKSLLPNYDVFDENRFFEAWHPECGPNIFNLAHFEASQLKNNSQLDLRIGVAICEDAWNFAQFEPKRWYDEDPIGRLMEGKAQVIINMAASPFSRQKPHFREEMLGDLAARSKVPVIMAAQVGAHDQLIFDGSSLAVNKSGETVARLPSFIEDMQIIEITDTAITSKSPLATQKSELQLLNDALLCGLRDFIHKCGATGVLLGLSGGADSALCASLAVQALGAENVLGVRMPSAFSSDHSLADAQKLADNLQIELRTIAIEPTVDSLRKIFVEQKLGSAQSQDICDQNLQARARGVILMGLSNLSGKFVLSTGNKSECAVGYATLYGDMCGALSPIADVYKSDVWALLKHINKDGEVIPENIVTKVPSAELKNNQKDQDTLPEYPLLDQVLQLYIDENKSIEEICAQSPLTLTEIKRIVSMIHLSEYKRWQSAPCLMVSKKVFGTGRRWPIAKSYHDSIAS